MTETLWRQLTGWVEVRVSGPGAESIVTRLVADGHKVWNLVRDTDESLRFMMTLAAVSDLRRAVRHRHLRIHFMRRGGARLLSKKIARRPMLGVGWIAAFLLVLSLCGRVWVIDAPVRGEPASARQELVQAAVRAGIEPGRPRQQIDLKKVALQMERSTRRYSWIRISLHGVVAEIQAAKVQARLPDRVVSRLVANRPGQILNIEVYMGESVVDPGQMVRTGQTLIKGVRSSVALGSEAAGQIKAPAVGRVTADVTYRVRIYQPFRQTVAKIEGKRWVKRQLWVLSGPKILLSVGKSPFSHYRAVSHTTPVVYRGVEMPLEWHWVVYNEIKETRRRLTMTQAVSDGSKRAQQEMNSNLPRGGRWIAKKSQVKRSPGGVWITLIWHADQDIAADPRSLRGRGTVSKQNSAP